MSKVFSLVFWIFVGVFCQSCNFDMCSITGSSSCRSPASEGVSELPSLAPPSPAAPTAPAQSPSVRSKGIRLDPAYFYSSHTGQSASAIASDVVTTLKAAGVNTIYLYAYNSIYGAYYNTSYADTQVENGYGQQNIFGAITDEAKQQGLQVVAVVPLNNFKKVWQNNPSWRVKQAGGADYLPISNTYLLSASVNEYKNWYMGFIDDLVAQNPNIDGVEAVEPTLDFSWNGVPDQNPAALALFNARFPSSAVGSTDWKNFRAQEFLNLIALFNQRVHLTGKQTYLVQTLTANANADLMDSATYKSSTGFDYDGVATLSGSSKTDHLITELIWQQWFSEYGNSNFNPEWVSTAGAALITRLRNLGSTCDLIMHVEISNFTGHNGSTTPTDSEFLRTINAVKSLNTGVSVYDYNQIRTRQAFDELSNW